MSDLESYLLFAGLEIADEMPHSIDEIITQNRHLMQLSMTCEDDLYPLYRLILPTDAPKDSMQNWSLVTLEHILEAEFEVFLLGDKSDGRGPRITSNVTGVDFGRKLITTTSGSVYALGDRAKEISPAHIIMICVALNESGIGEALGVAPFWKGT
ncbi:hypothetical protein GALL_285330 [mine drainage metagenome]|uniref:Uncharacterized protein n=1 Tax=mine drainage metagenome TaxID=410659 RepID=A0A1J5RN64_9ZZZZ